MFTSRICAIILAAQMHCAICTCIYPMGIYKAVCTRIRTVGGCPRSDTHTRLGFACLNPNYTQQLGKYLLYENILCLPLIFHQDTLVLTGYNFSISHAPGN